MSETLGGTFRDPGQPLAVRVADLLRRLTPAEKLGLMHQHQAAVPRLGLGRFRTGTEALHGVAWLGPATVFPQALGLASSWDLELVRRVGAAVGAEVRGLHHKDPDRAGLNVWAPVVNPLRDPRWGRNEEGYAEDPGLTGMIGTAYAGGLRGDHPFYLRTAPTLKHFLGYNNETDRARTSSNLPPRVLHEYELPAFRAPIAAGAAVAVMASYNLVNGRPAHLSPLINDELRGWTDDDVLVVGDAGAGVNIADAQGYHPDHIAGFAAAVRAGIDSFTEDDGDSGPTVERLTEALRRGLLDGTHIDAAVRHILAIRFRLGEFDPAEGNPYAATTADVINCAAHQRLARQAARRSIVLLKNRPARPDGEPVLPLPAGRVRSVAVIGPLADTVLTDWYSGSLPYAVSAYHGISGRLPTGATTFHEGADRIGLRVGAGWVCAGGQPDGEPLRVRNAPPGPAAGFDVFDWGGDTLALRAAANGRHVGVDPHGTLVNNQPGPNGWVVRETFRPVPRGSERVALHHLASDRYVAVGADGVLRAEATTVRAATAFTVVPIVDGLAEAAAVAGDADVAIVVLGNHPMVNGRETEDRADLALPPAQEALLRAVHAANPRTVLVLCSSYPYGIGWADAHLPAALWSAHGGQEYGHALADVLFGADDTGEPVDATGRLTQTWYRTAADLPDLLDYDIIATDATYLYHRGTPLYPFGHGLSYTRFDCGPPRLSATTVNAGATVTITVEVRNVGERPGEEVLQLYTRQRRSRVKQPLRRLRGFHRVRLPPGGRTTVSWSLPVDELAWWDAARGAKVVESARHSIQIGRSCLDIVRGATLDVHGEHLTARRAAAGELRATDHDDYDGTTPVDAGPERGDAVAATRAGGWLAFDGVDFGTGIDTVAVRASAPTGGATLTVRLDDPLAGPVAALIDVPERHRHDPAWAGAALHGAGGVRDLYLLFGAADVTVSCLTFGAAVDHGAVATAADSTG